MDARGRGRNNNSYSRGRGGGRNTNDDQGGRGRGGSRQNQGRGGRGGFQNQPPASLQWVNRPPPPANQPPPQSAWGNRPPQVAQPQQPRPAAVGTPENQPPPQLAWGNRPPQVAQPQQPRPAAVGTPANQPPPQSAWGNRPPQVAQPQQPRPAAVGPWTGKQWGPSSSSSTPPAQASRPSPTPLQRPPAFPDPPNAAMESLSLSKEGSPIQAMKRPDSGGTLSKRSVKLVVNHFPISYNKQGTIFHYDVDVQPMGNRPGKKPMRKSDLRFIKDLAFSGENELLNTAYDGEKSIFSAIRLSDLQVKVTVPEGEDVRSGEYMFTIKLVNELKLSKLLDYLTGGLTQVPRDILQGLDLVMKENPMRRTIPIGKRSFFTTRNAADLDDVLVAYKGFMPSLKPTKQGLALCLDYSVLSFRKPLPVFKFLEQHIGLRGPNDVVRMRREITNVLRGLKVNVTHRRTKQKYTVTGLTDKVARDIYFELEDREGNAPPQKTSLVDYFREKWGKEIAHVGIPCLDFAKPGQKPNAVPIEFCVLVEGQRFDKDALNKDNAAYLKKLTLVKPSERSITISDMVQAHDGPYGDIARNFGLILDKDMTKVEGRVLGAPELKVGGSRLVRVDAEKCQWNLLNRAFVDGKILDRWALFDFTVRDRNSLYVDRFLSNLTDRCKNLGITMEAPVVYTLTMNELASVDRLERLFQRAANEMNKKSKGKLQMVLCAMTRKDPGYKNLKWVSETKIGVVTQCFLSTSANKGQDQYLANLCLKINAKLGGTNFEVAGKLLNFNAADHVMFIGADVNHPAPMNKESPSIAAVVGTVNWPAANRYAARVTPQKHRCETIQTFGSMCLELVKAYVQVNNTRPKRIVLFRDGVSEGQFEMVLGQELHDLKECVWNSDYQPPITVIVAQKRHQTRLFVENMKDGGQTGNVPPGTVVDTKIVHPHDFDFYLCSHYGGIGTSKPTHYYVLWDENRFTSNQLQKLIYDMCFTFVRCTKPVSLVPPVFYADLVAYRGRMFQEALMESNPRGASTSTPSFDRSFYNMHSDLENMMFFV